MFLYLKKFHCILLNKLNDLLKKIKFLLFIEINI